MYIDIQFVFKKSYMSDKTLNIVLLTNTGIIQHWLFLSLPAIQTRIVEECMMNFVTIQAHSISVPYQQI